MHGSVCPDFRLAIRAQGLSLVSGSCGLSECSVWICGSCKHTQALSRGLHSQSVPQLLGILLGKSVFLCCHLQDPRVVDVLVSPSLVTCGWVCRGSSLQRKLVLSEPGLARLLSFAAGGVTFIQSIQSGACAPWAEAPVSSISGPLAEPASAPSSTVVAAVLTTCFCILLGRMCSTLGSPGKPVPAIA